MKLVDMKFTKEDKKAKEKGMEVCPSGYGDDYPYGLRLTLDNEQLEKLGISRLPKTGSVVELTAKAYVVSTRENSRDGGKKKRSVELQLRKIGLDIGGGSAEDAVKDALKDA